MQEPQGISFVTLILFRDVSIWDTGIATEDYLLLVGGGGGEGVRQTLIPPTHNIR